MARARERAREIYLPALFILHICALGGIVVGQEALSQKYYPLYDNKTIEVPIYAETIEKISYECIMDNKTMIISICSEDMAVKTMTAMKIVTISSKMIGYSDGEKDMIGYVNENKGIITRWEYDIEGRNLKDNPSCAQYEIDRGFCNEIY